MKTTFSMFIIVCLSVVGGCSHVVDVSYDGIYRDKIGRVYKTRQKLVLHYNFEPSYEVSNLNIELSSPMHISAENAEESVIQIIPAGTRYRVVKVVNISGPNQDTDILIGEMTTPDNLQPVTFIRWLGSKTLSKPRGRFP